MRNKLTKTFNGNAEFNNLRITAPLLISKVAINYNYKKETSQIWEIYSVIVQKHLYPVKKSKPTLPLDYSEFQYAQEYFYWINRLDVRDPLRDKLFYDDIFGTQNAVPYPCRKRGEVEKYVNHCRSISVITVIGMHYLNFSEITFLPGIGFDELLDSSMLSSQVKYIPLDLLTEEDINSIYRHNADFYFLSVGQNTFFYCTDNSGLFFEPRWSIFLSPFQPWVWCTIVVFCFLITFFNIFVKQGDRKIYNMFRIFLDSINYTFLTNGYLSYNLKNNRVLLSFIALNLVILVNVYFGIVTSDFLVLPTGQKFYDWNNLYEHGFRHLINYKFRNWIHIISAAEERYNIEHGINFTSPYKSDNNGNAYAVIGNFTQYSVSQYEVMRKVKGFDVFEILGELLHLREGGKYFDTSNGTIRCFLFDQRDRQIKHLLFITFHFWKSEIRMVSKYLEQAGIYRYWKLVENWQRLYNEFIKGSEEGISFGDKDYAPIPLNSHIQMIFYILACGHLFTGVVLIAEFLGFEDNFRKKIVERGSQYGGILVARMKQRMYFCYRKNR
ncbi:hypothetical protein Fcan01_23624 [Folsomia candida]|uniref:Uncharacterized protein n=1 Tax=Folsomia candida TaxID=158441 RepID=A0A226D8C0_FOLCA|nr:hypothetical protein Fcan01_23624 [Folsomia candida]